MKTKQLRNIFLALTALLSLYSCEKMIIDEEEPLQHSDANVIIRTSLYNIVPFDTRAVQNIEDVCTKICVVLYQDDTKVKDIRQKKGDTGYGEVELTLEPGTYQLLVLAHSSSSTPALTNPANIHFTNDDIYSDTFYYYGDLEVTSETATHDVLLKRATTLLRITLTDQIPSGVSYIKFQYSGGTGVWNAVEGKGGDVKSQQVMTYNVASYVNNTVPPLKLWTFLKEETTELQVTIQALNSDKAIITEKTLKDVPLKANMVTDYSGSLFGSSSSSNTFSFTAETDWEVYQTGTF